MVGVEKVSLPIITTDTHKFGPHHGSINDPGFSAFETIAGYTGKGLYGGVKAGEIRDVNPYTSPNARLINRVNEVGYARMAEAYGFRGERASRQFMEAFFQRRIDDALDTQAYVMRTVPGLSRYTDLSIEVPRDTNLASYIFRLADERTAEVVKADTRRILTWAFIAADIEANKRMDLGPWASAVEETVLRGLCVGRSGEFETTTQTAYHDSETNEVVAYLDLQANKWQVIVKGYESVPSEHGFNLKHHSYPARTTTDGSHIYVVRNRKEMPAAILKASRTADEVGGLVGGFKVNDMERMRIVELDGFDPRKRREEVVDTLKYRYGDDIRVMYDDLKKGRAGQSSGLQQEVRIKVQHVNAPSPFEIGFMSWLDYEKASTEVGGFDVETGRFLGPAHPLYTLRRTEQEIRKFYGDYIPDVTLDRILRHQYQAVAQDLRAQDIIAEGNKVDLLAIARNSEEHSHRSRLALTA